jgi:flagellar basal-body rod protein FlgF
MMRGIYASLSAVVAGARRQAIVADNLANVSTAGFKGSHATQTEFGLELRRSMGGGMGHLGTATIASGLTLDVAPGAIESTGVPTDLAIDGDGLFAIRTATGVAFTRAGDFVLDATGTLVTQQGEPVLGADGQPVRVPAGTTLTIGADGTVEATGQRLAIVAWPASGAVRLGDNRYAIGGPATLLASPRVRQGAIERSNVDMGAEMTDLMVTQRAFAMNARTLALQEGTLDATESIGRVR